MKESLQEIIKLTKEYLKTERLLGTEVIYLEKELPEIIKPEPVGQGFSLAQKEKSKPDTKSRSEGLPYSSPDIDIKNLDDLQGEVKKCTKCSLHKTRNNVVFGEGNPDAKLMLVGEAPGREEDIQGKPFVGEAGKLLTKMLKAINLKREDVYIGNILKCRPPHNRDPKPDEIAVCKPYLEKQIELIKPEIILALGRHSAWTLLGIDAPFKAIRGNVYIFKQAKLIPTYHPAALLYHPAWKKEAWIDLQLVQKLYEQS